MQALPEFVRSKSKDEIARRWLSLKNKMAKVQREAERTAQSIATSSTTLGSFAVARYARTRRKLQGKSVTFDKAGKADAFFWSGLAFSVVGATPLAGDAGRYVAAAGIGVACAGAVDFVDDLAAKHHNQ